MSDCQEATAQLLDSLQTALAKSDDQHAINRSLAGVLSQKTTSNDCPHASTREEPFMMLSLTVKGQPTVEHALRLFVKADKLDGDNKFMCGECKVKVSANKRTSIKSCPSVLVRPATVCPLSFICLFALTDLFESN